MNELPIREVGHDAAKTVAERATAAFGQAGVIIQRDGDWLSVENGQFKAKAFCQWGDRCSGLAWRQILFGKDGGRG